MDESDSAPAWVIPLTERAKKVLALAEDIARRDNHEAVGTAELLRALIREAHDDPTGPVGVLVQEWRDHKDPESLGSEG